MKIHLAVFTAATLNHSTLLNAAPSAHPSTSTAAAETATEAAALESAGRAAKAAEDWELKGESSFTADQSQRRALENSLKALTAYVSAHPNDVRALLLQA